MRRSAADEGEAPVGAPSGRGVLAMESGGAQHLGLPALAQGIERTLAVEGTIAIEEKRDLHPRLALGERRERLWNTAQDRTLLKLPERIDIAIGKWNSKQFPRRPPLAHRLAGNAQEFRHPGGRDGATFRRQEFAPRGDTAQLRPQFRRAWRGGGLERRQHRAKIVGGGERSAFISARQRRDGIGEVTGYPREQHLSSCRLGIQFQFFDGVRVIGHRGAIDNGMRDLITILSYVKNVKQCFNIGQTVAKRVEVRDRLRICGQRP